jgi:hypothetical protein
MSWASLADNQCISFNNLQDAVDNGIFAAIAGIPVSDFQITKADAQAEIVIPNPEYPPYALKINNQLLVKSDLYNTGTVTLSPQYGMYFSLISGSGFPSFSYPVTNLQVENYINVIPAQTIYINLLGTRFVIPLNLSVYVNGVLISCENITSNGAQLKTVVIPNNIYGPSSLFIAIDSGSCAVGPVPPSFNNLAFSSAAVSRSTGQYQVLAQTNSYSWKPGYVYVSDNYGVTWTQKFSLYSYWRKVATSDNGQYMLAVEWSNGYAWKSNDYGASWAQILNFPGPASQYSSGGDYNAIQQQNFGGAALSGNGQIQCIVTLVTHFTGGSSGSSGANLAIIWISTDYGSTWIQSPHQAHYHNEGYGGEQFNAVSMDSSGAIINIAVGDVAGPFGFIIHSNDSMTTYAQSEGSSIGANVIDIATTANGLTLSAACYSSQNYVFVLRSLDGGANYQRITQGSPSGVASNSWFKCCIFQYTETEVDTFAVPNYAAQIYYSPVSYPTPTMYPWVNNLSKTWTSLNCSGSGTYMLMTAREGVWRSANAGASFTQL